MTLTVIPRHTNIDGCVSSWQEEQKSNVIRSSMDTGAVKVRRRFTGTHTVVACELKMVASKYDDFKTWMDSTDNGVYPTFFVTPDKKERAFRITKPAVIRFNDPGMFTVSLELERFSAWP